MPKARLATSLLIGWLPFRCGVGVPNSKGFFGGRLGVTVSPLSISGSLVGKDRGGGDDILNNEQLRLTNAPKSKIA